MHWSFPIGRLTGIQIRVHLTFLIFLAWVGVSDGLAGGWRQKETTKKSRNEKHITKQKSKTTKITPKPKNQ